MKEFIVKENSNFKLRVRQSPCYKPDNLFSLEFINEQYKDGELVTSSTYNFFMTKDEINRLAESLSE